MRWFWRSATAGDRPRRSALALGIVDAADVDEADELAARIVAQEGQRRDDRSRSTVSVSSP
jgi:hypothetical protein